MGQAARGAIQETVASLASALCTGLNTSSHTLHSPSSPSSQARSTSTSNAQSQSNHTSDPEDSDSDETAIEELKTAQYQKDLLRSIASALSNVCFFSSLFYFIFYLFIFLSFYLYLFIYNIKV